MSSIVTPFGVIQLGTLNPAVQEQITQAIATAGGSAATATAQAGAAAASAANAASASTVAVNTALTAQYPNVTLANGYVSSMRAAQGVNADERHLSILAQFLGPLIASSAWPRIKELWVPLGANLTGALVKIKFPLGGSSSWSASGFASGDYIPSVGLSGDGASKILTSSTSPSNSGVAVGDNGMAAFTNFNSWAGILAGVAGSPPNANFYYLGNNTTSSSESFNGATTSRMQNGRMNFVQVSPTDNLMEAGIGGLVQSSNVMAQTTLPTGGLQLFGTGSAFFSNAAIMGFAHFSSLNQTELGLLSRFFESVNYALGRCGNAMNFMGDSYCVGVQIAQSARYSTIVAGALGLTEVNVGVASTTMAFAANQGQGGPTNTAAMWGFAPGTLGNAGTGLLPSVLVGSPAYWHFNLGLNDLSYRGDLDAYITQYETTILQMNASGVSSNRIVFDGIPFTPSGSVVNSFYTAQAAQAWEAALAALAAKHGCIFVPLYNLWNASNTGTFMQPDLVHPSPAGHALIANAILAAIASASSVG